MLLPARTAKLLDRGKWMKWNRFGGATVVVDYDRSIIMRTSLLVLALALLPAIATPALAQTRAEEQRWASAQRRYDSETSIYQRERDRYDQARRRGDYYRDGDRGRYDGPNGRDPYATDYDAARYYRDDPRYQERRLGAEDQVYRGSDGRYYCRRSDGTTGLIVGAAGGALLGNVIDGGRSRTAGTLIGGALGALIGRSVEQSQDVRCR
jgi:hypothetical protein